ncbi:MAG TPA: DNRLRE domain-containing protein [Phycisphaerae bacterium]|nr:DNRLRE domain-containing protein [Phycisphaerae bacterium]
MTRLTLPSACAALSALLALAPAAPAAGRVVALQQGADGYTGCTTVTLWGPTVAKPAGVSDKVCYVRGALQAEQYQDKDKDGKPVTKTRYHDAGNRVLVRFDLSGLPRGGKVARATLKVFVPKVENVRMINEILCREVAETWTDKATWAEAAAGRGWSTPGGALDAKTDYDNGRGAGAVDSRAFWEVDGQYFKHKYRFLSCPEGGTWLDFNVTPLAEKWLADPSSNHGVALQTITQGDKRFPNRMAIDIPSASAADPAGRPKLLLELAPAAQAFEVGMTDGLRKYCDRSSRYRYGGPWTDSYRMEMARNEFEPLQVVVRPVAGDLKGVTLAFEDLAGADGAKIPAADIAYNCQEMVQMHPNGKTRDWYFHGKEFRIPDPLSNGRPIDLTRHVATPFWVTVRTRPGTKAGLYSGAVTVRAANAPARRLKLEVKVWDYTIPERWNFQTMGQSNWGYFWQAYNPVIQEIQRTQGREAAQKKREELRRGHIDFLMDRRFMPIEQYTQNLSPSLADIPYCIERGGNTIYVNGSYRQSDQALQTLRQRCDALIELDRKLRAEGKLNHPETLMDMALVYIGDETNKWDEMRNNSNAIRRKCPELMIMIGGSFPRAELDGVIDIYDPQIGGSSKTFSLTEEMTGKIAASQAKGERFFWYDAAGPMLPYPNVQCEEPLIASRAVFWMTWKYGVTGFEYYCYGIWSHNLPGKDGKRWPEKPLTPWGWGDTNGDGLLFYPGPDGAFSSVRFENIRDGIEDWESHYVLRDYLEALEAKGASDAAARDLAARAKRLLAVPNEIVKDMMNWTWEPEVLLAGRRELGETIESLARRVSEKEMLAVRLKRHEAQVQRQRDMLTRRAEAARKPTP